MMNSDGSLETLSKSQTDDIVRNVVEQMACEGLRTICVAYRDFAPVNDSMLSFSMITFNKLIYFYLKLQMI